MVTRLLLLTVSFLLASIAQAEDVRIIPVSPNGGARAIIGKDAVKPLPAIQAEQLKKLAQAQGKVAEAIKVLANAQRIFVQAKSAEQKQEAQNEIKAAKLALEKAQNLVEAQMKAAQMSPLRRMTVNAGRGGFASPSTASGKPVKASDDPIERFLLFSPSGPLLVEAEITVDGKPFRQLREPLIDKMMTYADSNKDGKATWDEALASSRFSFGRLRITTDNQKAGYLRLYDLNKNGLVERDEASRAYVAITRANSFVVAAGSGGYFYGRSMVFANGRVSTGGTGASVDLVPILDVDQDGVVSAQEIVKAGERLQSRDADDNELLYPQEILTNSTPNRTATNSRRARPTTRVSAIAVGSTVSPEEVYQIIKSQYKNRDGDVTVESFLLAKSLFHQLDINDNGKFDADEASRLLDAEPQITLTVDLGPQGKGATIKHVSLQKSSNGKPTDETASVEFPGLIFKAKVHQGPANYPYSERLGESYLSRYDKDNNGYLDKNELTGSFSRYLEMWDGNADGKIFPKEIVESFQQTREPLSKQVRATVSRDGNSLFQALDQSGDGRLSLREMRTARAQLQSFDNNKDGKITTEEIPETIGVTFVLGYGYIQVGRPVQGTRSNVTPPKPDAPEWFIRMDRNGDGYVTIKEFLGDKEQFQSLDANQDGFIEPKEAKSAKK